MRYDDLQRTSRDRQDKKHKLIQQPKNTNNGEPIDLRRNPEPKVQQKICLRGALEYCEMRLRQELAMSHQRERTPKPRCRKWRATKTTMQQHKRESSTLLEGRRRRHEAAVQETGRLLVEVSIDPKERFFVSFHRPFRRPNSSLFVLTTSHIDGGGVGAQGL
jgi:hypothetical protein